MNRLHVKKIVTIISILIFSISISEANKTKKIKTNDIMEMIMEDKSEDLSNWLKQGNSANTVLLENFSLISLSVYDACRPKVLKVLLDKGVDPNSTGGPIKKPIVLNAAEHKNTECLNLLIKYGVQLDSIDKNGNNAYHYALLSNNKKSIDILYETGLDLFQRNNNGLTFIDAAVLTDKSSLVKDVLENYRKR